MLRKTMATAALLIAAMAVRADVSISADVITTGTEIKVLGPGPNLQEIIDDDITDAAVDKPYLIKLGPGEYPLSAPLAMKPFVSIMGSGQGVTILKGAISTTVDDASSAVVSGADDASLTDLSVENTGGSTWSTAIYNYTASPRIENVEATASGGTSTNYGVLNTGLTLTGSSPTMINVSAKASGGLNAYGVSSDTASSPTMTNVTAMGLGGINENYGIKFAGTASSVMSNVTVKASGGALSYGLGLTVNTDVFVDSSTLDGATYGIFFGLNPAAQISNTRIVGGFINDYTLSNNCRNTYDENLTNIAC